MSMTIEINGKKLDLTLIEIAYEGSKPVTPKQIKLNKTQITIGNDVATYLGKYTQIYHDKGNLFIGLKSAKEVDSDVFKITKKTNVSSITLPLNLRKLLVEEKVKMKVYSTYWFDKEKLVLINYEKEE